MRVTLSWDISNPDPAIRAWRIYGNPEPTLNVRGQFIRELPVSESRCTFDVQEGAWKFVVLGVKREETETPFETASGTRGGLFFARGVKCQPLPPEDVGGGLVGDEVRVQVRARAPDEQPNKVQLIGGPPASVYSIAGPGFGHLLEEFAEARADLLADDVGRALSHGRRAEGQGMAVDRRLWVRSISYDGTPSTAVERTLYPPERAHLDGRVVASIDGAAGTYTGFPAPGANDGWEASATYGFRAKQLPVVGGAGWSNWGAVGGTGLFSSLLTLGRYVDNAKIRTDQIDLGATQLFQLDTYHEAHRRDSVWGTKTVREWNAVPGIPCEFRRMRNDRPHAGWTMREVLVGGEPRQPLRDVWWEFVAGTVSPVPTAESDWKRLVPGQWIRARYFRVRLRFEEPLPWFRFATGNVQIAVLRSRHVTTGSGSPEGSVAAPLGATYVNTATTPATVFHKTTQTGNTGWVGAAASAMPLVYGDGSIPAGNTIANTASATSFASTYTIPANRLVAGSLIEVDLWGILGTDVVGPTLVLSIRVGGVVFVGTAAVTLTGGMTALGWHMRARMLVTAAGAGGTAECHGDASVPTSSTNSQGVPAWNTSPLSLDTTATKVVDARVQFGTAHLSNTITLHLMTVKILDPA